MDATKVFGAYELRLRQRKVGTTALREYRLTTAAFVRWLREQEMEMAAVRRPHIEDFMAASGWAPTTQRSRLTWLRAPWAYAVEQEVLDRSPFGGLRIELERPPQMEPVTIPNKQLRSIKAGLRSTTDWTFFHLLAYTGARLFECRAMTWNDVSFKDSTIWIMGKGNRERTIPMHPALQTALKDQGLWYKGSAYLLPGAITGKPLTHTGGHTKVKKWGVCPHDFRRTLASSLTANEADRDAARQILGHGPEDIHAKHYVHLEQWVLYREILKAYANDPI